MDNSNFKRPDRMTSEMLAVIDQLPDFKAEYLLCLEREAQANGDQAGHISLPATSANGKPVIHRSRLDMLAFSGYWLWRRRAIENFLDPDEWRKWKDEWLEAHPEAKKKVK